MGEAAAAMIDPTTVRPPGSPNTYLVCPGSSCAATADSASPTFDRPVDELERAWRSAVETEPRVVLLEHDAERHLYLFVQRSAWFGFPDLVSVRFLPSKGGSTLAVYSRSVYGYWDLGVNRRRVEAWLTKMERALSEEAAVNEAGFPPLQGYRWTHRPLLVFARSCDSQALAEQARILFEQSAGLDERDVAIVTVAGDDVSDPVGRARGDAATLRSAYDVDEADFAVLLVGKDGGVKLRAAEPVAVEQLFALIDAMPMRQREMRAPAGSAL